MYYLWSIFFGSNAITPFKARSAFSGASGSKLVKDQSTQKSGKGVDVKYKKKANVIKDSDVLED